MVGDIVHFYSTSLPGGGHNGTGPGPYAAMVVQAFADHNGSVRYINLTVFPPFAPAFSEGSVSEGDGEMSRYWAWPPGRAPDAA